MPRYLTEPMFTALEVVVITIGFSLLAIGVVAVFVGLVD